jgi:hypothetical protein
MRLAEPSDAPAIARLVNDAVRSERFFIDADRTDSEKVAALMQKGKFLMRFEEGELVGYVYTEIRGERGYFGLLAVHSRTAAFGNWRASHRSRGSVLPSRWMQVYGSHLRECALGIAELL